MCVELKPSDLHIWLSRQRCVEVVALFLNSIPRQFTTAIQQPSPPLHKEFGPSCRQAALLEKCASPILHKRLAGQQTGEAFADS